ncbi:TPA: helix-turn-helix transcriptional regulator [Candidatus Avigastranaerophilus faecigallinarum]|nr:helix-turn-helix transcriptional regulator [Candidatus Avigastranaerophilus faecigallinarum]
MANSKIEIIQNNIKKYRNKRGLTQDKLSEMASISCDYLSEIERGKKIPSLKRFIAIADALDIPYEKFFKEK